MSDQDTGKEVVEEVVELERSVFAMLIASSEVVYKILLLPLPLLLAPLTLPLPLFPLTLPPPPDSRLMFTLLPPPLPPALPLSLPRPLACTANLFANTHKSPD